MNISEVAKKTGLTSKTIRFYEEKGLMTAPNRADNGYRFYGENILKSSRCCVRRGRWALRWTNAVSWSGFS